MSTERLRSLLESEYSWPSHYLFKFVVPMARKDDVVALLPKGPVILRESRKGNYVSVSANPEMASSDDVLAIYASAAEIEGLIAL